VRVVAYLRTRCITTDRFGRRSGEDQVRGEAVAATVAMFSLGTVRQSLATSDIQVMGVQETLKGMNGPLISYTVTGLVPSSDPFGTRSLAGYMRPR
jgi:hypothetical protein